MTVYLSQLIGKPVWDAAGQRLGKLTDALVAEEGHRFPPLRAIAVQPSSGGEVLVPASELAWLFPSIILRGKSSAPYQSRGDEVRLRRQLLDRQIVDTEGRRLVRVNDLQLAHGAKPGQYHLSSANVGTASFMRRLGLEAMAARLLRPLHQQLPERVISWEDVASVEAEAPIRLRVAREKLSRMEPADIASIVSELDRTSGQALMEAFDNEVTADAIAEVEPPLQTAIITAMPPERAADVLEEMDPDDAADLLATVDADRRASLLDLMEQDDADEVEMLLGYPEHSAGGIMTTEFATVTTGLTVGEALEHLRQSPEAKEDEALYYVHVVDVSGRLQGVVSLSDLVLASPEAAVADVMSARMVTVSPREAEAEVARRLAKYNLLSVPVVDDDGTLRGIVTVDDALDAVLPTAWKKRLPRFY